MKKALKVSLVFFTALALLLTFNIKSLNAQASDNQANVFGTTEEVLEQEKIFQEIIKDVPSSTYLPTGDSLSTYAGSGGYIAQAGDVLYTPSTQCKDDSDICKGISGHVGIVNPSKGSVTHTAGKGKKPEVISLSQWFSNYPKTVVVRHNNTTTASKAANWAINYYGIGGAGSNKSYKVTVDSDLTKTLSLSTTYCSLLVWQAYYFGGGQHLSLNIPVVPVLFVNYASQHNMYVYKKMGY